MTALLPGSLTEQIAQLERAESDARAAALSAAVAELADPATQLVWLQLEGGREYPVPRRVAEHLRAALQGLPHTRTTNR